jgi:putative colanic acid biosynthesis UDP-glucose lipid carrier transferase
MLPEPAPAAEACLELGRRAAVPSVHAPIRLPAPGPASLASFLIDATLAPGVLLASAAWSGVRLNSSYAILALLAAALTMACRAPLRSSASTLNGTVIGLQWGLVCSILLVLGAATGTLQLFDMSVLLGWMIAVPLVQIAAHSSVPVILGHVLTKDAARRTAVIAGVNPTGCLLSRRIAEDPMLAMSVAGYFDDRDCSGVDGVEPRQLLGSLAEVAEFVKRHHVEVVYCALPCWHPRIRRLVESLHDTTASVYFVPDVLSFDLIQARVDTVAGLPVIALCESPFRGSSAVVKRLSDLVLASIAVVLAAPLCLAIAIAIKMTSPGPVIFRQRRYGVDGREIVVYKFRTMTCLEDGQVVRQATRDDARTTRVGRVLRRYSLDELPQFFNVLQGRMSVIGPRPHAVAHNETYRKLIPGYMIRHKVRPGITGLAQVRGLRGETDTAKMRARVECDLEYLREWSLLLDAGILLRTIGILLERDNAY